MTLMTPSEALVETLVAHGVKDVFGIVGSAMLDMLDIFEPAGLRFIGVQHEQAAAHMADGYSRVSGKQGVCMAQNGPGVSNLVTGVAAAYWAHSPVFCITPEAATSTQGMGGFQEIEQLPFFEKITKYQAHVVRSDRIAEQASRCLDLALVERGPTQLNVPRDLFYAEVDVDIPCPTPLADPAGSPETIALAAELIAAASFPVVLAGGGVVSGDAVNEVKSLAEFLSAPVVTQHLHNDAFPGGHPLMCGPIGYQGSKAAMAVLSQADVVLAIGSRLGPFGKVMQYDLDYWPKAAKFIQIDVNHRVLGLTQKVDVPIWGGARTCAIALQRELEGDTREILAHGNRDERLIEVARRKEEWRSLLDAWTTEGSPNEIRPRRALRELQRALPGDAMVTTDVGNIASTASSYLQFERPRSFFAAMSWGNCGYAFPTAIGAKVAAPDRPAIAIVGDGAWGMSMHEVLTCVREEIPVTAVVFNNQQWGAEKRNQMDFYAERYVGSILENPSFAEIARAMGASAVHIDTIDQIGSALRDAAKASCVSVIEIPVTRDLVEPFRRDALKRPVRKLPKYKKYSLAETY